MVCRVPEKLLQRSPSTLLRAVGLSNGRSDFLRRHQDLHIKNSLSSDFSDYDIVETRWQLRLTIYLYFPSV